MLSFFTHRLSYALLVLLGVILSVFILFLALPGDPARLTVGQRTDITTLQNINHELGLDQPKWKQFILYINDLSPLSIYDKNATQIPKLNGFSLLKFNNEVIIVKLPYLRTSYQTGGSVGSMLLQALPNTIVLAIAALLIALLIGIPLGMLAALHKNKWDDRAALLGSVLGISLPSFYAAILIQWLFAFVLGNITGLRMTGTLLEPDENGVNRIVWSHLILPAITLGIRPVAIFTQLTRNAMLDVISQDYVRTAFAKGLAKRKVVWRHALRNALNPVLTAASGWLAEMLAGAFFVETVFNWNGIGKLTVDALEKNDFPVVMGSVLFAATIFVFVNMGTDLMYGFLDPRLRTK